jgi:hypothetical protein
MGEKVDRDRAHRSPTIQLRCAIFQRARLGNSAHMTHHGEPVLRFRNGTPEAQLGQPPPEQPRGAEQRHRADGHEWQEIGEQVGESGTL